MCQTLIYIGSKYYSESGTVMSSLMTDDGQRSNWMTVKQALLQDHTVTIRPATELELHFADQLLATLKGKL